MDYEGRPYEPMNSFWRQLGGKLMGSRFRMSQLEVVVAMVAGVGSCDAAEHIYSDEDRESVEELFAEVLDIQFTVS